MLISIEWFRLFFIQMKYHYYIKLIVFTLFFIACSDSNEGTSNVPQINPKKCIVLGNSITLHGINSYWWGEWGMAASTRENDFVHKLESKINSRGLNYVCTPVNIANWETSLDLNSVNFSALKIADYDVVVIRLGENISDDVESEVCEMALKELISSIKKQNKDIKIYMTGVFWPNASKETAIKNAASLENVKYINIDKFYTNENMHTLGDQVYGDDGLLHTIEHGGVAAHPNDLGMEAIAEEIFIAMFP